MFDKMKAKAAKGKQWVIDHKQDFRDIAWYTAGAVVGITSMVIIGKMNENKQLSENLERFPDEINVLKHKQFANGMYSGAGSGGPTVGELSNKIVDLGVPEDAVVVGSLIYIKK